MEDQLVSFDDDFASTEDVVEKESTVAAVKEDENNTVMNSVS